MKTNTFLKIATAVIFITLQATIATVDAQNDPLDQWNEGLAKAAIISFVEAVTDQANPAFLRVGANIWELFFLSHLLRKW